MNQFAKKRFVLTGILFFFCLMYGYSQTSKNKQQPIFSQVSN